MALVDVGGGLNKAQTALRCDLVHDLLSAASNASTQLLYPGDDRRRFLLGVDVRKCRRALIALAAQCVPAHDLLMLQTLPALGSTINLHRLERVYMTVRPSDLMTRVIDDFEVADR